MQVFLETERLLLRRFTEADVDNLLHLDSDPEVMRFVGGKSTTREAIETEFLPAYLRYYVRSNRYGFWAAIERSSQAFLGWFHLRPLEGAGPDEPELGYRLCKSAWGQGYATEDGDAVEYALTKTDWMQRQEAGVSPG
jgi:RimJ/RimL family protein N-acetyltransferase